MSKSRKGPIKDHEIENLLQIWQSSEEESSDDEDFQATGKDFIPQSVNTLLDQIQGLSNDDLLQILEEGPLLNPPACVPTPQLDTNLVANEDLELLPHNDRAGPSQSQSLLTRPLTPELVPNLQIEDLEELQHDVRAGPFQHPSSRTLTPELVPNLPENEDMEVLPHYARAGPFQHPSSRTLTPELVPNLPEYEDMEVLPHYARAGPFQHPSSRTLTPELVPILPENEDMEVLPHYARAGPSQHPPTHPQAPELYSSLPENETAAAGDGVLHDSEFEQIPEGPTYAELQSKVREWTTQIENFETHHFNGELESTKLYNHKSTPIDYFNNMFPEELFQVIVNNTNKYARLKNSKFWNDVDINEVKAFLAIVILMGIAPQSDIELYWNSDPFYTNPEISGTMTCKKFKKILENIHVCDVTTHLPPSHKDYDKLQKIRPMLTILNRTFQENATNSQAQSIDESMVKFKGRDSKKQYMPLKPIKRGYKAWCRCDAKTGYLYQCDIYCGKDNEPNEEGLGFRVVKKFCVNVPRNTLIVFDNFFSSVALVEYLYSKGIFSIGTVRMTRKGLPKDFANKLKPGEFTYRFCDPIGVIKWRDTKDVHVITTAVNPRDIEIIERRQKNGEKKKMYCPSAIAEYTRNMGGVDYFDHFRSSYSIGRRSKKSWLRLFWFLFECAIINSYIMYKHKNESRQNIHRDFRLRLARSLKSGYINIQKQSPIVFKNKKGGIFGVPDEIRLGRIGQHYLEPSSYKRCRFCSTRKEEKRSKFMCKVCKVTLCVFPCMENFHQNRNF